MVAICDVLRAAGGPLTFREIAGRVLGTRAVTRPGQGSRWRASVPNGDVSNLRRAFRALLRRGTVVEFGAARLRFELSDRFTQNEPKPASGILPLVETGGGEAT